jgi:two-component system OmpR family response regulator
VAARDRQLILIADDDPTMREVVRFALEKEGYPTLVATDGRQALALFTERRPALLILDILMPELDGTDVCREIRRVSETPIIFLSSKDDELDRILGLELGGDDYVTKPFSPRELVARVKAMLRRLDKETARAEGTGQSGKSEPKPTPSLSYGKLRLDMDRFKAVLDQAEITLTAMEFQLLKALMTAPTKVFTRDDLIQRAYDNVVVADRTIDSHIRRIRKKFADTGLDPIETVTGFGYKMGVKP